MQIQITPSIQIDESELAFQFIRASGPGGQNVNKVSSAVQLRFDVGRSPSLPPGVRRRLIQLAGKRITADGVLVIEARRHRTQAQNRQEAVERLKTLIQTAARPPRIRKKTGIPHKSKIKRLASKKRRSRLKRHRGRVSTEDEG